MSTVEADRFLSRLETDDAFVQRVSALGTDANAVFELVRSEGYDCTPDEIKDAFLETYGSQLTAEQLESIAGGIDTATALGVGLGGGLGAIAVGAGVAAASIAAGAI